MKTDSATIAAIGTPFGEGGVGIIRISGDASGSILERIFQPAPGRDNPSDPKTGLPANRVLAYGRIVDPESCEVLDEVLAVFFKGPATYTREDMAEIHCHGSVVSLRRVLGLVLREGARPAEAGEFTKLAFLNGRLDLAQAEAVLDLIRARTDKGFEVAMGQLEGRLSGRLRKIREALLELLATLTVNIDYPDEDIEELLYSELIESITQIGGMIENLRVTTGTGRILQEGLKVSIIGKPNVGKSSLMNALLRETRAIVTDIPGTTRDTIRESLSIQGIPVQLTDTAGIRETENAIEQMGIERSKASFMEADLILLMLDVSQELSEEDKYIIEHIGNRRTLILANKIDLGARATMEEIRTFLPDARIIETSMVLETGLGEVEEEIKSLVYGGKVSQKESLVVTSARHGQLLDQAAEAADQALGLAQRGEALEIVEIELRAAYDALGEILGETVGGDVLDQVFARFCIGK